MHASETNFQPIIEGTKQYVVPLFQRAYSWTKKEWNVLWEDLVFLCENEEPKSHFIGSIVTMPTISVPEGVSKFLLIDGQQRLTTIFIILALIRDIALANNEQNLAEKINQTMLVNPFEGKSDYFKLLPTQIDRSIFQTIIQKETVEQESQILNCYKFLQSKIKQDSLELSTLHKVITSRLSVVSIVLNSDDNPHLVFESLNAKGRPLTQADLIRNYFFMRIHINEQESRYAELWQPMQEGLNSSLTEFIRHYLMKDGAVVKQSDVYFILKEAVEKQNAIIALKELLTFSRYYERLVDPAKEPNAKIRDALYELNRLEVTTAYPFLLNCYHDYDSGTISLDDFYTILQVVQNFVIRRFICNVPTNALNKIFPALYRQAKLRSSRDMITGICTELQTRDYPKDAEFRSRLIESKLYGGGDRRKKTKYILEKLEASFCHKEQVDFSELQIEHVMPQTLTDEWLQHLGEEWQAEHELFLHTLGNLTLTAYNPELSNASFSEKKAHFHESHLELNKYFENCTEWNGTAIQARADELATTALSIWPYFGNTESSMLNEDDVKGQIPQTLIFIGQVIEVNSWRDVLIETLNTIIELDETVFNKILEELSKFISHDKDSFRSSRSLKNGYFIEVNLSAKDIYKFCLQCLELSNLSLEDWEVKTK